MGQETVWLQVHGPGAGREFKHVDTSHVAPLGLKSEIGDPGLFALLMQTYSQ